MSLKEKSAFARGRSPRFRLRTLLAAVAAFALVFGVANMARRRLTLLKVAARLATRESSARRQEAFHQRRAETVRHWAEDWRKEAAGRRQQTETARDRCERFADYWDDLATDFETRAARSRAKAERLAMLRDSFLHSAARPWGAPPRDSLEAAP